MALARFDDNFLYYEHWHLWPYRPEVFFAPEALDIRLARRIVKAAVPTEWRGFTLRNLQVRAVDADVGRLLEMKAEYHVQVWVQGLRAWQERTERWEEIVRYDPVKQFGVVTEDNGYEPCAYSALLNRTGGYPCVMMEHMGRAYIRYKDLVNPMEI